MRVDKIVYGLKLKPAGAALVALADYMRHVPAVGYSAMAVNKQTGKLTLCLGDKWLEASDPEKVELLEHEAHHIACGSFQRIGERDPQIWNMATDCAINEHLDRAKLPPDGCFFESWNVSPMPAERMYEIIKQQNGGKGEGCGHQPLDMSAVPISKLPGLIKIGTEIANSIQAGQSSGQGVDIELPPVREYPEWVKTLEKLLKSKVETVRKRSWMRENRAIGVVRGRQRVKRRSQMGGLVLLDASGSMCDELPMILALVKHYLPKVEGAVWDTIASQRGPVAGMTEKLRTVGGGGTSPSCAAGLRRPGEISVWISDGYVDHWPEMTGDDIIVLTQDGQEPDGGTIIRTT